VTGKLGRRGKLELIAIIGFLIVYTGMGKILSKLSKQTKQNAKIIEQNEKIIELLSSKG